ncbi:hypothetical protein [Listeria floridensis]|uniref:hypothetical protein n=1 Tax=Listeria floridensis TaxID=1494962 RepID=UPI0019D3FA54|nr:hypothetical protein [Listeria floridensis]
MDEDSKEAYVKLTDGNYSIESFCSNCELSEDDVFSGILHGFTVKNVIKDFNTDYGIDKKSR